MAIIVGDLIARLNLDGSGYQKGVAEINRQTRLVQSQFDLASARLGNFGTGLDGLRLKSQTLSAQLSVQSGRVQLLEEAHRRSVEAVGADARASQELQIRLNQARAEQQRMENDLRDTNGRIDEQSSSWYRLSQSMNAIGDQMQKVGKKMTEVGKTMSLAVTAPIVAFGTLAVKSAIEFESAFAGVRKTVDGTEAELASLRAGILKMSREIPAAATEIAKVAEAAGQLGIEKESILGFTRTMVDLGVATNLSSDEAATALARLANITQMPQSEFNKLGSTIVALGNNLATTEAEIVAMGLRIAGAGSQIGLTEAQILSFAGALSSVGIEAEAGGSSISRVMIDIGQAVATGGDGLNNFAKVAGMSAGDFKQAFETDAANALVTFIEGLGRISEAGANVFGVLEDLGLSEIRVRDALLRASGAGDLFRESLELGSKAWEENNALNKEAGERYKTTESQLKILRNRIDDMMGTIGDALIPILLDVVKALDPVINKLASMADAFYAMDASSKKTILAIVGMVAAIGPLLVVTGVVVSSIGSVISALGVVSGSIAAAGGIAAAFSKVMALAVAPIKAVGAALTFLVTNPIGLAITAISLLVVGLVALNRHMQKDSIPAVESFGNEAQNAAQKATGSFKKFRTESKQELDKAAGTTKAAGEQIGKDFSLGVSKGTKKAKDAAVADMKEMVDRMKEEVDRSTKSLDKLGDAISQALKKRYDEQEKLAISAKEAEIKEAEKTSEAKIKLQEQQQKAVEKSAEEELKTQKKLTDNKIKELDKEYAAKLKSLDIETSGQVKAIQDQIDAIDKQTDAEDKAREQQEHNDKLTELNKQLAAAETAEERIKIQAEINKEIAAYNRAQLLETRKTAKEQLKSQIDVIKEAAADKKEALKQELSDKKDHEKDLLEALVERLNDEKEKTKTHYSDLKESEQEKLKSVKETLGEEKDAIKEHYAELTTKEALLAESRLQIIEQNNDEIIQLLSEYNPKWQDAGQSFAESLAEGLASEKQTIEDAVKGVIDIAPAIHAQTQELETLQSKLKELEKAAKAAGEAGGAGAAGSNISTGDTSLPIVPGAPSPNVKKIVEASQEMRLESFKAFQGLRNDAEKELKTLQWSGSKVTEETAAAIADNFFAMGSTILDNLEASNTDQLKSMKNFFKNSSALTEEEELAALEKIKNSQLESAKEVEVGQKRVAEILSKALDDKRILTKDEYAEINKIQADMNKEAERALGAHEIEQKTILERMKTEAGAISTRQAAEIVTNSVNAKNGAIQEAEAQYKGVIAEVIRQRDQVGSLTAEQAKKLIEEAKKQRDESIKYAEESHKGVLEEAKKQSTGHTSEVDWETGEIKSKWAVFRTDVADTWKNIVSDVKTKVNEQLFEVKAGWRDMKTAISDKMGEIGTSLSGKWGEIEKFFSSIDLKEIGKNIIQGLIDGVMSKGVALGESMKEVGKNIKDSITDYLKIKSPSRVMIGIGEYAGEGLAVGLQNSLVDIRKQSEAMAAAAIPGMSALSVPGVNSRGDGNGASGDITNIFEGMFSGAEFTVRTDDDIRAIAEAVSSVLGSHTKQAYRGLGGATV